MKKPEIKLKYHDALYWASSNQSKGLEYHLTRTEEAVMRKLIHYSTKKEFINYSNELIAQHTFMGEETIRKAIPSLNKKKYISTILHKIIDNGQILTRRSIRIKWDYIGKILLQVPQPIKK